MEEAQEGHKHFLYHSSELDTEVIPANFSLTTVDQLSNTLISSLCLKV